MDQDHPLISVDTNELRKTRLVQNLVTAILAIRTKRQAPFMIWENTVNHGDRIYKICPRSEWEQAVTVGEYRGSTVDLRDGFIHFSASHQVTETAQKHFADQSDLLLIAIEPTKLGVRLKWEPSRGGNLFPHLYGPLQTELADSVCLLVRDENGTVIL